MAGSGSLFRSFSSSCDTILPTNDYKNASRGESRRENVIVATSSDVNFEHEVPSLSSQRGSRRHTLGNARLLSRHNNVEVGHTAEKSLLSQRLAGLYNSIAQSTDRNEAESDDCSNRSFRNSDIDVFHGRDSDAGHHANVPADDNLTSRNEHCPLPWMITNSSSRVATPMTSYSSQNDTETSDHKFRNQVTKEASKLFCVDYLEDSPNMKLHPVIVNTSTTNTSSITETTSSTQPFPKPLSFASRAVGRLSSAIQLTLSPFRNTQSPRVSSQSHTADNTSFPNRVVTEESHEDTPCPHSNSSMPSSVQPVNQRLTGQIVTTPQSMKMLTKDKDDRSVGGDITDEKRDGGYHNLVFEAPGQHCQNVTADAYVVKPIPSDRPIMQHLSSKPSTSRDTSFLQKMNAKLQMQKQIAACYKIAIENRNDEVKRLHGQLHGRQPPKSDAATQATIITSEAELFCLSNSIDQCDAALRNDVLDDIRSAERNKQYEDCAVSPFSSESRLSLPPQIRPAILTYERNIELHLVNQPTVQDASAQIGKIPSNADVAVDATPQVNEVGVQFLDDENSYLKNKESYETTVHLKEECEHWQCRFQEAVRRLAEESLEHEESQTQLMKLTKENEELRNKLSETEETLQGLTLKLNEQEEVTLEVSDAEDGQLTESFEEGDTRKVMPSEERVVGEKLYDTQRGVDARRIQEKMVVEPLSFVDVSAGKFYDDHEESFNDLSEHTTDGTISPITKEPSISKIRRLVVSAHSMPYSKKIGGKKTAGGNKINKISSPVFRKNKRTYGLRSAAISNKTTLDDEEAVKNMMSAESENYSGGEGRAIIGKHKNTDKVKDAAVSRAVTERQEVEVTSAVAIGEEGQISADLHKSDVYVEGQVGKNTIGSRAGRKRVGMEVRLVKRYKNTCGDAPVTDDGENAAINLKERAPKKGRKNKSNYLMLSEDVENAMKSETIEGSKRRTGRMESDTNDKIIDVSKVEDNEAVSTDNWDSTEMQRKSKPKHYTRMKGTEHQIKGVLESADAITGTISVSPDHDSPAVVSYEEHSYVTPTIEVTSRSKSYDKDKSVSVTHTAGKAASGGKFLKSGKTAIKEVRNSNKKTFNKLECTSSSSAGNIVVARNCSQIPADAAGIPTGLEFSDERAGSKKGKSPAAKGPRTRSGGAA